MYRSKEKIEYQIFFRCKINKNVIDKLYYLCYPEVYKMHFFFIFKWLFCWVLAFIYLNVREKKQEIIFRQKTVTSFSQPLLKNELFGDMLLKKPNKKHTIVAYYVNLTKRSKILLLPWKWQNGGHLELFCYLITILFPVWFLPKFKMWE